jgi:hypothetical protein
MTHSYIGDGYHDQRVFQWGFFYQRPYKRTNNSNHTTYNFYILKACSIGDFRFLHFDKYFDNTCHHRNSIKKRHLNFDMLTRWKMPTNSISRRSQTRSIVLNGDWFFNLASLIGIVLFAPFLIDVSFFNRDLPEPSLSHFSIVLTKSKKIKK